MPDIPPEIRAAGARAVIEAAEDFGTVAVTDDYGTMHIAGPAGKLADAVLDATASLLAQAVAGKILAHMQTWMPNASAAGAPAARGWRRHMGIAARLAAGAFLTEDEIRQQAAESIARGDFVACPIPEEKQ